ncbi:zinc ABC transporter substrate-binding protein, partial [Burkholderia sp. SIMBA_013]
VIYARNVADGLAAADPARADAYRKRADAYIARVQAADAAVRKTFAAIPQERRKVVTSHDAFGYFGDAYGVSFIAAMGVSTEAE